MLLRAATCFGSTSKIFSKHDIASLMYLASTEYWIIKDARTTPKVIVCKVSLNSLSGSVATNATERAPLMPPIITTFLHVFGVFSLVNLLVKPSIGYVDAALAAN